MTTSSLTFSQSFPLPSTTTQHFSMQVQSLLKTLTHSSPTALSLTTQLNKEMQVQYSLTVTSHTHAIILFTTLHSSTTLHCSMEEQSSTITLSHCSLEITHSRIIVLNMGMILLLILCNCRMLIRITVGYCMKYWTKRLLIRWNYQMLKCFMCLNHKWVEH
jgi:hypothetical protein